MVAHPTTPQPRAPHWAIAGPGVAGRSGVQYRVGRSKANLKISFHDSALHTSASQMTSVTLKIASFVMCHLGFRVMAFQRSIFKADEQHLVFRQCFDNNCFSEPK